MVERTTQPERTSARAAEVETFILQEVDRHGGDLAKVTAERFGISRQAVNRHLKRMLAEGKLVASGATRSRHYEAAVLAAKQFQVPISQALDEHDVWTEHIEALLAGVHRNIFDICHYGFTEMVNNAKDHSGGQTVWIAIARSASKITFVIHDDGVGIFRKISAALALPDERLAILELSKGKLTTDPKKHSGEGIFFTSKMFDNYKIDSGSITLFCDAANSVLFDQREPWLPVEEVLGSESVKGTRVIMQISVFSSRTMVEVFDRFSDTVEEDYGFIRTQVPVSLARFGDDNLVSRSQAKRLLARFERFKEVILDFKGVETIGQAFADEIFRVFRGEHPAVHLTWINAAPQVERMIRRALTANPG